VAKHLINDVTFFRSLYDTTPSAEYSGLSVGRTIDMIAPPDGPRIVADKKQAPYVVPCLLAVRPYVNSTAERFPVGAVGKQRSSAHVTESAWFAFDLDDINSEDEDKINGRLKGKRVVFCAYSTHSHGQDAGKVRMRVLIFMGRKLGPTDWTRGWHVVNKHLLDSKGDPATAKMSQAAGVWCAHPDRVSSSFRIVGRGQPLCADELLKLAPKPTPQKAKFVPPPTKPGAHRARYGAALHWLDAADYQTWRGALMYLRAAVEVGDLADAEGRELWLTWSATAPADRQARNGQAQYSPGDMWDRKPKLTTAASILVAALFKRARDEAERCVRLELPSKLSTRAVEAATYLRRFHPSTFEKLRSAA